MKEVISLRSYTRKVYDLGGRSRRARCHVGHVHYFDDAAGALADIDHTWRDQGAAWEMTRASYRMRVAKDFGAANLIGYRNRFEGANHDITYEPHSLVWAVGRGLTDVRPFRAQVNVPGLVVGHVVRYADAFGRGLHFEITLRGSGFVKELVIESRAALEQPPTPQHRLVLLSRYQQRGATIVDSTGRAWAGHGEFDDSQDEGFKLNDTSGGHRSIVRPAYIVESDADETRHRCPVIWTARNGALWQAKVLPRAVLNTGTYPLRADTVTSYYAGAGDGYVEANASTWDLAHDAVNGVTADYTSTTTRVSSGEFTLWGIRRAFFPIDTSGIPDTDTINSATFYAKTSSVGDNNDNDGDDFFVIVGPTTQADPTQLVTADYDTCGSVDAPQEITADRKDFSGMAAAGSYNSWVLNATGLGIISKTGYTLIGLREGHDVVDSAIVGGFGSDNQIRFYTSEQAGTGDDPYLEVDYTVSSGFQAAWARGANAVLRPGK